MEKIIYFSKGVPEYGERDATTPDIKTLIDILFDTDEWTKQEVQEVLERFAAVPLGCVFEVRGESFVRVRRAK